MTSNKFSLLFHSVRFFAEAKVVSLAVGFGLCERCLNFIGGVHQYLPVAKSRCFNGFL